jgi:cephalosporin-C deacetylase
VSASVDEKRTAFWRAVVAEVAALPFDVQLQAVPRYSDDKVAISALSFRGVGNAEVACWMARPRGETIGVLVQFPAYATVLFPPVGYAEQGMIAVSVSVRGHHGSEIPGVGFPGLLIEGLPSADTYIYRSVYADALRAVTLVARLIGPGLPLVLMGQSQGAALSLVAAGLTGQAVAVAADVPFLCSIREALALTTAFPYRELSAYLRDRPDEAEEALRTVDIFDVLGFAPQVTCPVLMSIGTRDPVTPLAATRALARALPVVEAIEYEGAGHEGGGMAHRVLQTKWILNQFKNARL